MPPALGIKIACQVTTNHHFLLMDNLEQRMSCEFESRSWRGVLDMLCEKVCQFESFKCNRK
jgi:hypothetical protein